MNVRRHLATVLVVLVTIAISGMFTPVFRAEYPVPTSLFIVYAPCVNVTTIAEHLQKANVSSTFTLSVEVDIPADLDYMVLWILTGRKPGNASLLNVSEDLASRVYTLWSKAGLVDIPFVDPKSHNYTINPVVAVKTILPPELLRVPVNSSTYWDRLATNVSTIFDGVKLEVRLDAYNTTMISLDVEKIRELGPKAIKVNLTADIQVEYYILFYLVRIDGNTVELFFPGVLPTTGYMSDGIKPLEGANIHWYIPLIMNVTILKELPENVTIWWLSKTVGFISSMVMRASFDIKTPVYHVYVPHAYLAKRAQLNESVVEKLIEDLTSTLAGAIRQFMLSEDRRAVVLVLSDRYGENLLVASNVPITIPEDVDLSMIQLVGLALSYSDISFIPHAGLMFEAARVAELDRELEDARRKLVSTELELNSTKRELVACTAELEIARSRLLNLDELEATARSMHRVALTYILGGFLATIIVSVILGYLAYVVAKKVGSRKSQVHGI